MGQFTFLMRKYSPSHSFWSIFCTSIYLRVYPGYLGVSERDKLINAMASSLPPLKNNHTAQSTRKKQDQGNRTHTNRRLDSQHAEKKPSANQENYTQAYSQTSQSNKSYNKKKQRRFRFRIPLAIRVSIFFGLPILFAMGSLFNFIIESQRSFQKQQMDNFGAVISEQLAASAREPLFADAKMELVVLIKQIPLANDLLGAAILNHSHEVIAHIGPIPNISNMAYKNFKTNLSASDFEKENITTKAVMYSKPIEFRSVTGGHAVIVMDQENIDKRFENYTYALYGILTFFAIIIYGVLLFVSHRLTQPVREIVSAAKRIEKGDMTPIKERRNDELGQLIRAINSMTKGLTEKSQIERVLHKFLDPDISNKILQELDPVDLQSENVEATVLFADIVGFTSMSEKISPEEVTELLNEYFGYYSSCAKFYFGNVDKFLGDCIMIVFGATKKDKDHKFHAAACAVLMQKLTNQINQLRLMKNLMPINIRIGINSGHMIAGLIGSRDHVEYTVIGDSVNLASRLCNEAQSNEIIIQGDLSDSLGKDYAMKLEDKRLIKVRGKENPVPIYNLKDINLARTSGTEYLMRDILENAKENLTPIRIG